MQQPLFKHNSLTTTVPLNVTTGIKSNADGERNSFCWTNLSTMTKAMLFIVCVTGYSFGRKKKLRWKWLKIPIILKCSLSIYFHPQKIIIFLYCYSSVYCRFRVPSIGTFKVLTLWMFFEGIWSLALRHNMVNLFFAFPSWQSGTQLPKLINWTFLIIYGRGWNSGSQVVLKLPSSSGHI